MPPPSVRVRAARRLLDRRPGEARAVQSDTKHYLYQLLLLIVSLTEASFLTPKFDVRTFKVTIKKSDSTKFTCRKLSTNDCSLVFNG